MSMSSYLTCVTLCLSQKFFKEANETYSNLQKEHEMVRKKFTCDKDTSLEDLLELLKGLEVTASYTSNRSAP